MKSNKTLKEAMEWLPSEGFRERPSKLWKALMKIPYKKEEKNGELTKHNE